MSLPRNSIVAWLDCLARWTYTVRSHDSHIMIMISWDESLILHHLLLLKINSIEAFPVITFGNISLQFLHAAISDCFDASQVLKSWPESLEYYTKSSWQTDDSPNKSSCLCSCVKSFTGNQNFVQPKLCPARSKRDATSVRKLVTTESTTLRSREYHGLTPCLCNEPLFLPFLLKCDCRKGATEDNRGEPGDDWIRKDCWASWAANELAPQKPNDFVGQYKKQLQVEFRRAMRHAYLGPE